MLEDRTTRNFIRGKKGKTLGQKDPSAKSAKSNLEEQSNKRSKINEESQKKNQEFVQPFYFDTTPYTFLNLDLDIQILKIAY